MDVDYRDTSVDVDYRDTRDFLSCLREMCCVRCEGIERSECESLRPRGVEPGSRGQERSTSGGIRDRDWLDDLGS